jgi:hypothetical protein
MSFDLEFWSDGDGFHPFARHGQAKRCRQGLQSTIGSRPAGGDRAVGALFSLRQRKVERERIPHRAGGAIEAATQAARQLAHDPQAATKLDPSKARAVVGDAAVDARARTHQADFYFAVSAIEAGMADRVRHQLVDGQRQAPAPLRLQQQRFSRQHEADVHAIQLASAHRKSEVPELFARVQERIAIRRGQNAMNLDMLMKQVDDIAQRFLDLDVISPDCFEGDEVDDRGELVLDAVIQLVQKGSSSSVGV